MHAPKGSTVDIPLLLELDEQRRALLAEQEQLRSEQKKIGKEVGPQLGKLKGQLKAASGDDQATLQAQVRELEARPAELKQRIQSLDEAIEAIEPQWRSLQLHIPQPPDADVPRGSSADDNVEIRRWAPEGWNWECRLGGQSRLPRKDTP